MKQKLLLLSIALAMVSGIQAASVSQSAARQIADSFFASKSSRFKAPAAQAVTRLAYTAEQDRFYIFDRGERGGFVVVAGDDRLPQVLGYGNEGDFSATLPPAVQYWMDEMNRQIEYLQSHGNVSAHQPAKRAAAVDPMLTTQWDQGAPYNDFCPTYTDGSKTYRSASGCVATAMVQVMNYHKWPAVGRGNHSYTCNVNGTTPTELYADFSESVYQWDLMLDQYDQNSSPESCEAVAELMLDAGISVEMDYGSSSGASEVDALSAFQRYFDYYDRSYILARDYFNAEEWDQFLVDELSARRPILYCGHATDAGHAFVFDGFDADGYFHVNWGWGGYYDGYFLVSLLKPGGTDFKYMHDAMFGVTPSPQAGDVEDVLYVRSGLVPSTHSAQLGSSVTVDVEDFVVVGNRATGYKFYNGEKNYYVELPMSLGVYDKNGVVRLETYYNHLEVLGNAWSSSGQSISLNLLSSLEDGEYKIKLYYSLDEGQNYDQEVLNFNGQELYIKMIVRDGTAYLYDCFLSNQYSVDSFRIPENITVKEPINVDVTMSYSPWWSSNPGPVGNVYLSMYKYGTEEEVATSEMYEVQLQPRTPETYQMQITAPAEWGRYHLTLKDEDGNRMAVTPDGWWSWEVEETQQPIFVLPVCDALVEDFESMTANSSTSQTNVQGAFTTWSFSKAGVRSPEEDRCNGSNSVMVKKAGYIYTAQPLAHNFFLAQATFFNPVAYDAIYSLEYSLNGGNTWIKANTIDGENSAEVPKKSQATKMWLLNLSSAQPAQFRIAMIGGGTAATYIDDVTLYYIDVVGDVNADGEISIADINALVDIILNSLNTVSTADVNGDKEITVADINALIQIILSR